MTLRSSQCSRRSRRDSTGRCEGLFGRAGSFQTPHALCRARYASRGRYLLRCLKVSPEMAHATPRAGSRAKFPRSSFRVRLSHKSPSDPVCRTVTGRPMFKTPTHCNRWDETVASAANRDTSPTAQVPKLFGPIYATASRACSTRWRMGASVSAQGAEPALVALRCRTPCTANGQRGALQLGRHHR
ncbi:MAG: hypothetical protein V7607_3866 [Solirubrobacteraceae bacterium]